MYLLRSCQTPSLIQLFQLLFQKHQPYSVLIIFFFYPEDTGAREAAVNNLVKVDEFLVMAKGGYKTILT